MINPMPLKHATETLLIVVLAAAIVLAGLLSVVLPHLPDGLLPWSIGFVLSLGYPLALYPLFKSRRADYSLRMLHAAPAVILGVWMVLELVTSFIAPPLDMHRWFTWSSAVLLAAAAFALIAGYCFSVLRQRNERIMFLSILFVPFLAVAVMGETLRWDTQLASLMGAPAIGTGALAQKPNMDPSPDADEEEWREKLRERERLEQEKSSAAAAAQSSKKTSAKSSKGILIGQASGGQRSSAPPHLPSAGPDPALLAVLCLAGFTAAVQKRARRAILAA